jgi:hypothetical protein
LTKNAENDTKRTSIMEENKKTTDINEKKKTLPTEKLIICEIVFCGLAIRSVNNVRDMPIAENSIRY